VTLDRKAQRDAGIALQKVEARSLPEVLQATGRIALNENRTWRIGAVTDGRITHVYVNAGDRVEAGQVLARMYSHDIHEARAEYQRAVSELDRLKANLDYARRVRERTRRLYELKAASLQQLEQAESEYKNAEAAVAHGQVELERTRRHLTDFLKVPINVSAAEHEEEALVPITAPAAGTLLQRRVSIGTVVERSSELFVVTDLSMLCMIAAVSEEHLPRLRVGMPVRIQVQAYPERTFPGRLARLAEELDPTTRTVMARVEIPNPSGMLKPEMYATAELELGGSEPALFVPQTALQEVNGHPSVFVRVSEERFEARPVELGRLIGASRQVTSGLKAGEWVVSQGSFILKSLLLASGTAEQ
jgi:cobalt-zinc-cadmium efflux system membrane fusion protein